MRKLAVSIVHHSMGSDRQQLGGGPVNKLLALAFLLSFCAASVGASLDALWQDNHSPLSAGTSVMGVLMLSLIHIFPALPPGMAPAPLFPGLPGRRSGRWRRR